MAALLHTGQHPLMTFGTGYPRHRLAQPPPRGRGGRAPTTGIVRRTSRIGLVVIVAALYTCVGISAPDIDRKLGLAGVLLILGSLTVTPRSRAVAAVPLLLGALPLAITTWWGVATPLLAALCPLLCWPQRSRITGAKTLLG